jgi:hypothetical protein
VPIPNPTPSFAKVPALLNPRRVQETILFSAMPLSCQRDGFRRRHRSCAIVFWPKDRRLFEPRRRGKAEMRAQHRFGLAQSALHPTVIS